MGACNVGASSPEESGGYFAWGETTTKTKYTEENSVTTGLYDSDLESHGYIDNERNLTPSHDAATVNWGGDWRMPTYDEMQELVENCVCTWSIKNGVKGITMTGPNDEHIFIPAAGQRDGSNLQYPDNGFYCVSTMLGYFDNGAFGLYFNSNIIQVNATNFRYLGRSVRPVLGIE